MPPLQRNVSIIGNDSKRLAWLHVLWHVQQLGAPHYDLCEAEAQEGAEPGFESKASSE